MFGFLMSSKEQKLIKKWEKEHLQIIELAQSAMANYSKDNLPAAKKNLIALNGLAVGHIMNEDLELYKIVKNNKKISQEAVQSMDNFKKTFKDTKNALMDFLRKYSRKETVLDEEFYEKFNALVPVLVERIQWEEKNLYTILNDKSHTK